MSIRLFKSKDRWEAHEFLQGHLAVHPESAAECREDPNDTEAPFSVWDGPASAVREGQAPLGAAAPLTDEAATQIAEKLFKLMNPGT